MTSHIKVLRGSSLRLLAIVIALGSTLASCSLLLPSPFDLKTFRSDEWRLMSQAGEENKRFEMLGDLTQNVLVLGMTPQETTDLLGEPDFISGETNYYVAGFPPSGIWIDPEVLHLEFSEGKLVSFGHSEG